MLIGERGAMGPHCPKGPGRSSHPRTRRFAVPEALELGSPTWR
jgi:hypothetical protein